MKREINVLDYANQIISATKTGVLVTTKAQGQVNSMTISWGTLGIEWGKLIYTVFVRTSRHTKTLLDQSMEFTINIPMDGNCKEILSFCGTKSRRDVDKIKHLNLTLESALLIETPAIKELPLTLECKVIYKQYQEESAINQECKQRYYPESIESEGDYHTAYYGEIVAAYIIE